MAAQDVKLNILGSLWTLKAVRQQDDDKLERCDGYTDKTTRTMVVLGEATKDSELGNYSEYLKKIKRHEILHAYLFESGLHENFTHPEYGHDETFLDWVAVQFPKILATYKEANAL